MDLKARVLSFTLVSALCACGGGGTASVPSALSKGASAGSPTALGSATFAYGAQMLTGKSATGPANIGWLKVDVAMQLQNGPGLLAYAGAVSTPGSGVYRHFLTPQQIAGQYGASAANYSAAAAYFRHYGLKVGGWAQRLSLAVAGPQSAMEAAFHTHFVTYTTSAGTLVGPQTTPSFGASLPVAAVSNLISSATPSLHRQFVVVPPAPGSAQNQASGYVPQQIAAAFDYNGAYSAGFRGDGITIGIIGTGPYDPDDYVAFKKAFGFPGSGTITQVDATSAAAAVGGGGPGQGSPTATPPPVTAPCSGSLPACNPEDGEAQLDTEQATSLGYDANVLFYLAYVPAECQTPGPCSPSNPHYLGPRIGLDESDDEIQQAISDNTADVLSLSYGGPEVASQLYFLSNGAYNSNGFGPLEFAALAAEGIATFVSAGDTGAQGCAHLNFDQSANCVEYPASDDSVTAVGGVTTPLDNAGRFIGPITAWGVQTEGGAAGTGGGVSAYIPQPTWQTGAGITAGLRNVPDMALEADLTTGVATYVNVDFGNNAALEPIGGTSVAAPETAAMWALVLSACRQTPACAAGGTGSHPYRLGNAAPVFYTIYNTPALYPTAFYDVTFGNNGVTPCEVVDGCPTYPPPTPQPGFNAGVGYDRTTGVGVPFARHLIKAVVGI